MEVFSAMLFAAALSMDGFGAGVAYGLRKIRVPLLSLIIVSVASGVSIWAAMAAGNLIAQYIPYARQVGAGLLIIAGIWLMITNRSQREHVPNLQGQTELEWVMALHLRPFGLIIHIMREPVRADMDCSGVLSCKEAFLLGIALALDAMAAGLGIAMSGFSTWLIVPLVVLAKFGFVTLGLLLGDAWSLSLRHRPVLGMLPGLILAGLGAFRLL
ncbi:MAG: sporulation membrane protein YtaF [Limnochordia bacterium]|nr:sporulation membrane protein YtaF [Bacillota bacterium]